MLIRAVLKAMRLPFLVLTPVSVLLGVASALQETAAFTVLDLVLVLVGALSAHIAVNTLNEYQDFVSGLDAKTERTPFSGGSGALIHSPDAAPAVLVTAVLGISLTLLIGIYFLVRGGWFIFPIGCLGIFLILTYTTWLNRQPFLCLVAPGVAFGPLMVVGTEWVLTGNISIIGIWVSIVPFCLANNLLLLNQFPDMEADRAVGRRHFPIAYGRNKSIVLYGALLSVAFVVLMIGVLLDVLPGASLGALLPLLLDLIVWRGIQQNSDIRRLIPYMAMNVVVSVTTPLALAIALIIA